jgi:protocatechuate 3,4-dioxygenase, beta subunit
MKKVFLFSVLLLFSNFVCSQDKDKTQKQDESKQIPFGGNCEGCEAVYESPVAHEQLASIDTLPDFNEDGPKIEISGVIYKADGVTPAPDVIVYIYHTDQQGYYSKKGNEKGWGMRHGYIRAWLKTNEKGEYKFYTLRPASYPNSTFAAHIHTIIKEPDKNEYWIDDFVFDDDKFVDEKYRKSVHDNGGSGIITLSKNDNGSYTGKRDIILGKNITGYPRQ